MHGSPLQSSETNTNRFAWVGRTEVDTPRSLLVLLNDMAESKMQEESMKLGKAACTIHTLITSETADLECSHKLSCGGIIHGQHTISVSSNDVGCIYSRCSMTGSCRDRGTLTGIHRHTHTQLY